jgi:proteasome lid subunit RPN8/RPN11
MLTEVVIDRRVLDTFKRRAFKALPLEYAEILWGTIKGYSVHVCAAEPMELFDQGKNTVDYEYEHPPGTKAGRYMLLGSIHTHPHPYACVPSEDDIERAEYDKEVIWGILAIRKRGKRRFSTVRFWSTADGEMEVVIAETANENDTKRRRSK